MDNPFYLSFLFSIMKMFTKEQSVPSDDVGGANNT